MMASMNDAKARKPRTDTSAPPDDDELAELMNPDAWDWDNALIGDPAPSPTLTIGIRLDADEARVLGDAARAANMPLSQYIKRVALEAVKRPRRVSPGHHKTKGVA